MQTVKLFHVGFELTTACPCRCITCGSDAGVPRRDELTTTEWLDQVRAVATAGAKRLCLLGGEPLLYPGWQSIVRLGTNLGLDVDMISCGIGITPELVEQIRQSGLVSITISVDGTEAAHNELRRVRGGYQESLNAIRWLDEAGVKVGVATQINRLTLTTLEALADELQDAGAMGWQLQLTIPVGRACAHRGLVLSPEEMPEVFAVIRRLVARRGLRPYISDNLGYLTHDDPVLRTPQRCMDRCWCGCFAGTRTVGVTSRGDVKGCLSLPDSLIEGNIREQPFAQIWGDMSRFSYNRNYQVDLLGQACSACKLSSVCRGGCTSASVTVKGKPHQGPYCLRLQGDGQHV